MSRSDPVPAIPGEVLGLARSLSAKMAETSPTLHLDAAAAYTSDPSLTLFVALHAAESTTHAAQDLRSLLIAYAHGVSQPRPPLPKLAEAQGLSLSALTRRYSRAQLSAVHSLISSAPDVEEILLAYTSLEAIDLLDISPRLTEATLEHTSQLKDCAQLMRESRMGSAVPELRVLADFPSDVRAAADEQRDRLRVDRANDLGVEELRPGQ